MKKTIFILIVTLFSASATLLAQRQMEKLNRGLVAMRTSTTTVFLSWRLLGTDPDNVGFNIYRDGVKVNSTPITSSTNFSDAASSAATYTLKTTIDGNENAETCTASVWTNNYLDIPLDVPATMTMPDASTCTYSPNDCSVGDADGDGEYELFVKWDPSNSKDNSQSGYTGDVYIDCYKLNGTKLWRIDLGKNIRAGAHYTQFQVADYDGDGKAEIACKTAPGTLDGLGNYLSKGVAATNTLAINTTDYRNSSGYVLSGAEYLTVFSGLTGAELATANFNPQRGTVSAWGDSYGNRVDRFLAATAYLDGIHPSIIMCRGYYTRLCVAAWDFKNNTLSQRWMYDSGNSSGVGAYGQGNHNLSVGDVDDDGKDEIIYGSSAFDDNGSLMYSTGLGHGDAMHLTDLNPDRKGLEVWEVHEETGIAHNYEMHDAKTGAVLWGGPTSTTDNGRGLAANVLSSNRGFEMWSADGPGVSSVNGTTLVTGSPSMNFRIYWDGDLEDELLDGTTITKYNSGTLLSATDCYSNNSTKSTPCLSVDILGDWREELILRTSDNSRLRIFSTTTLTSNKLYTLMHDCHYRNSVAWQNTAYNQPPHCGFYMGSDMDAAPVSAIYNNEKRWKAGSAWDVGSSLSWADSTGSVSAFHNGDKVLFDLSAAADANVTLSADLYPQRMKVFSPYNVTLSGTGTLCGSMDVKKNGQGTLTFNNNNPFTGSTTVWDGALINNGNLSQTDVTVWSFASLGGNGVFGGNVTMGNNTNFTPGAVAGIPSKLVIQKNLKENGIVNYSWDVSVSNGTVIANDTLIIGGNWTLSNKSTIKLNIVGGTLPPGNYVLAKCAGTVTGDLTKFTFTGIPAAMSYSFLNVNGDIILHVKNPSMLQWKGTVDSKWDNDKTLNWMYGSLAQTFMSNDSVLFNDDSNTKTISLGEIVYPSQTIVDATANYSIAATGAIAGTADLIKKGTGKLTLSGSNTFTGKTMINGGTLEVSTLTNGGIASPMGAASNASSNIQFNGGKLSYTGSTVAIDRGWTLNENGGSFVVNSSSAVVSTSGKITGKGTLTKEGAGRLAVSVANDYTGGTIIKAGSIGLLNDVANVSGVGTTDTITFMGGSLVMYDSNTTSNTSNWNLKVPAGYTGTLSVDGMSTISGSVTGAGSLTYYSNYTANTLNANLSKFAGTLNVSTDADGGWLCLYNTAGYAATRINLANLVTMMYRVSSTITIPVGDLIGQANSVLGAGGTGACTITWEVGGRNANSTFNGTITNAQYSGSGAVAALRKVGTGTWTLTNASTFTGGTTIQAGTVLLTNTSGSGLGSGSVVVNQGGTLAGTGTISGALTLNSGATLSPGNSIGTFTVNNNMLVNSGATLAFDIDKTNAKYDQIALSGTLTMAGKIQLNALNGTVYAGGDSLKLIKGTIVGMPTEISPESPGENLQWDWTDFNTAGVLKVKQTTAFNDKSISLKICPNPFVQHLYICTSEPLSNASLKITDLAGVVVFDQQCDISGSLTLDLSTLRCGIYILQLNDGKQLVTSKIVKK